MTKAIVIVGLPGSGKSHYAARLAEKSGAIIFDDASKNYICPIDIMKDIIQHEDVILIDPMLCFQGVRDKAEQVLEEYGVETEWVFFENDPERCAENAAARADKNVGPDIRAMSSFYCVPQDIIPLPVWKKK
jgi:predicted kinase